MHGIVGIGVKHPKVHNDLSLTKKEVVLVHYS